MHCQPTASHFVNGAYLEDKAGAEFPVIYPATGEQIARLHQATPAVIESAIQSAVAAQKIWAQTQAKERGRVLLRAAAIIRERNRELSILETYDTGKPLSETLYADATSGADALEYFGGLAATLTGEHIPLQDGDFVYTRREPLGVCLGIGAWNYPTQIACWKAAPALTCGNAMIFKPSETTPLCALQIAQILIEAGAPKGLFNVVQGFGEVAQSLVQDPRIAKVSLTGSVPTGKKVYQAAAAQMKHVTMELGGKSPLIIFEDADIDSAVSGAILANFYSSGQVCSNGTRVFVHKSIRERFVAKLISRLEAGIIMGDPLDERVNFGPMTSQRQLSIVQDYINKGIAEGAKLEYGGERVAGEGFYLTPAIFTQVTDSMTIAREEIFGPVMAVLDFEDEAEVIERANATEFGLAAGLFTQNIQRAHRISAQFEAGTCYINCYNLAPVEAPFGGSKMSGIGRENSKLAIEHYSQMKSVYVALSPCVAPY